ncbi:hypothetical protein NTGZN8_300046 [Candidatus Nitrotoga fabula]|uniref:Uncharacterized protein n=1 Tax=Candidatus Nitrotoga fabula TaxID=2182327 RepID=A0A916F9V4_9PROT|nr:hypothetical protein NTGZN8_300046 [Candidatus Nitrotoga fabula]
MKYLLATNGVKHMKLKTKPVEVNYYNGSIIQETLHSGCYDNTM